MMSADGMAAAMDESYLEEQALVDEAAIVEIIHDQEETALVEVNSQTNEVVFVDTSVKDYEKLVNDLQKAAEDGRNLEIVLIDSESDGISQITETLSKHNDLDAVHIYSHGSEGQIRLGDSWLDLTTLSQNAEAASAWGDALSEDADILIFGCDLASTDAGEQFVDALAQLTGADITASDDQTGSFGLGGNWELEYAHGQIEAETLIDQDTELSWEGLLAPPTAANNTVTTNEDTTYTFTDSDFNYSDGDGDPMASVKITTLETVGSLQLSGIDVTINQVITKADIDAGNLTFIPVTAHNGTGYDSFDFSVNDGTTDSASSYTLTVDVTAVNDAPTFNSPAFSSNTITTGADGARDVQVVDMDGDGDMDVLSASSNDGEIAWYENDGSENFTAHTITTISTAAESAFSVQVADLDGDGDMDVFSASYADDEIAWYENDGSENFTAHVIDSSTTADGATSVHVADVDGDGDLDVLSSSLWTGDIVWYENDGSENFTTHNIALSYYPLDVTTADFDDDGDLDLLSVGYYSGDITWHENDGSENFTSHTIDTFNTASEIAGSVHVADVDDDGDLDVLATIYGDDKINWYENDGSENFTSHTITSSADGAYSVTTADVDGDGDLDVLSASELDDKIAWYENDGSENFTARTITTGADGARSVAAVDMDGDGNLDVVSASFNDDKIAWYENTPTTTLDGTPSFTEGGVAVVLDADVDVSDAELDALNSGSGNYSGATVTLVRNGGANSDDIYSETGTLSALTESGNLVVGGTTIGTVTTNSGGTLVLTFDSNATTALVNSALQQIAYSNSSDDPSASAQIDWSFDDGNTGASQGTGGALQATGSTTVTITAANDAPTAANNTVTTNEDTTYTFTAADFNYSDPESDTMASVKITTLETVGSLHLSGFDVTLNQVITKADIDAGNLEFVPVGDGNGTGYDSFGFSVNDGTTDSVSTYTMTVDVTAVNDAPTFSTGDGIVTTAIGSGDDRGRDVTVQTDGKILVAGYSYNGTDNDFSLTRYNADGTLDTTFGGGDGIVTTDIGSSDDYGQSVKVQSDGKIVVAGYSWDGADYQFALVRYDTDGTLDTTFDTDGKATTDLTTGDDKVYSVDIQSDGKILVAGRNGDLDFALVRYNTDGSLDTDFDSDGIVAIDFPYGGSDYGDQVLVQSDGKILVSGRADVSAGNADFAVARLNSDGSLDTTFGGGVGMVTTPISGAHDMGHGISLQSDGKIVQSGYVNGTKDFAVIRYNTDGTLDTTFDTDGIVTTDFGGSNDYAYRTTVQADGKILVMGESDIDGDYDFALVRYNTDGSLDTTFDSDGIVTTDFGNGDDYTYDIVTQSDGKILIVGQSPNGSNDDISLVRYNADGSLDTSFNLVTTLDGAPSFTEGGAAVVLDSNVVVSDAELDALNGGSGNYSGATVTLVRNGGANSDDVYSETGTLSALTESGNLVVGGTTIGTVTTNSGGTLVLTFDSNATTTLVNSALQQIAYSNSSDDPSASAQIDWSFDDGNTGASQGTGGALQATGSTTVTITAVNDEPTLTSTGSDPTFTEGGSAVGLFSGAAVSAVESGQTITGLTFTVTNVTDTGNEQITIDGATITLDDLESGSTTDFSYSVSVSGTTATVTLSGGTVSTANVVSDIDNATYINNSQDPTDANRVVTITAVVDSGGTANGGDNTGTPVATSTVNVNPVNDAIDITVTGNTVLFTEDAGTTTSLFSSTIDTIEAADTITQLILTMANIESGDTLTFGATNIDLNTDGATVAGGFTYTVSSAGVSPVVTITHAGADDATVNTMLNSLVFNNTTNNDPSTTARTVTLTSVTDSGSGLTADGTVATVNVAKADDAIDITVTGNTVSFTEDAGATTSLFSSSIDTIEPGDTITQVILTMANIESGDTLTFGATDIDLNTDGATVASGFTYTVSSAGVSPVVTITHAGADDATVNTMLDSLVFNNTANNDPSTTARTVTLTSVTDSGSGTTADGTVATVNVAKADDAIDITVTGNTVLFTEDAGATTSLFSSAIDTIETTDTITQVILTMANVESGDTLSFGATDIDLNTNGATVASGFTYTVSSAGATPVVTITHAGTDDATVNTMLNSLVFNNTTNNDPSTTARTVTLTSVTDSGSGTTADGTVATVNVAKADDAIDITVTGNTVSFTEDAGATTSLFSSSIDTIETGDTITQVILTLANVEAGDTLSFGATDIDLNTNGATVASGFTYTVSSAGVSPVVTITHAGTDDGTVNTMLDSLVFNNTTNNDPSTTARTVTLTSVTDSGSGLTADGTVATVNVAKADDAIDITATGNTVSFTEDAGATTSLFSSSIDTIETGDTITQVILTMANIESGDTLTFGATDIDLNTDGATVASGFTYTVSSAGVSPVVTITHAGADDATVNTMLDSLVFNNTTNNDPSTTARTVTLTSVTDSGSGLTADGTVATVNVAKADDAIDITVTGNTVTFTEDAGATTSLFSSSIDTIETGDTITQVILTMANVEAGDTLSFGATDIDLNTNGATVASGFTYTVSSAGATPVVTITHAGTDDGTVNTMLNSLVFNNTTNNDPSTTARTVTLTSVTDSGSGTTADGTVATVNVAKANDAIDITVTGNTVLFTEDAGATTSLFSSTIDTIETTDTITQVILTMANVESGDTLTFGATNIDLNTNGATGPDGDGFTYTVSSAGATPVVTITHAGTDDATVNTMLNSLVFNNTTNNDPSTTARTVTLTSVTDSGSGTTADGTVATVNVAKADDAIDITVTGNTVLFTEDAGATTSLFSSTIDTIETTDTITQVILTMANVESGDTLSFGATDIDLNTNGATVASGFTYTVSSAGATPVVTITHAGTDDATVNTMLNSLVFNNTTNNDPSTTARTVTLTSVTDSGSGTTADGTVATVNVAKANDAIDITVTGNTVLFSEDAGATTSLFSSTIDTIETTDTITQVILTMANVESGDTLSFGATNIDLNTNGATVAGGFTYTVSSAGASPVVTITHAGTDDGTINTMLDSLVFNNTTNNDPGTTARTVTLTSVTDSGSGTTADGTVATVNVAKADDAIDITVTGNTVLFTEDSGATTSLFSSTIDTIETGDTITQLILTMANVESGDTLSFGATNIDLNTNGATVAGGFTYTVSSAGSTPVVTITHAGTDDATVNTMLNSAVFNNTTNNDPSTTARTVTLTSVTDSGSGTTADGTVATVNVAKADDAIDITVTGNTVLFTEDAGATTSLFSSTIDTIETTDTITQVILTMANVESGDTLTFGATDIDLNTNGATVASGFTYTVSSAGATPVVTITHAGTDDATVNTMLNSLVFNNTTNNDPSTTARTVTLTSVTDSGSGTTADGTVATVNVAKADDAIDITVTGNTVLFTEDAGATTSLFSSTIDTIETSDTITQVILTMANVESGDTLSFGATDIDLNTNGATVAGGFTYTVSSAGATPVVTITHAGTDDATVNTMLNSLVFNNTTNNDPSTTARTVTLTSVTDSGSGITADGTVATVNVAKADDAIDITVTGNTVTFTEDAGATTALFAAAIDTIETGDTITQVVLTMANVESGDTLSFGATNIDLNTNGATVAGGFTYTVSSAGATPVVTITHAGTDDATVNTMLNSLVFNNTTNNDPSTTARTVTLTSVTDSGSGTTADGTVATVNVAKADDAIDITVTGNTVLFTEDAGATTSLFSSTIDTIETGDTISQIILTMANVESGDTLSFGATDIDLNTNGATVASGFTYTVSSAGATPVVTITHAGTDDGTVNTMLNSLVFNNTTNNDPSTTARTVTLTSVTDSGSGTTADGTVATVNVAKADDAIDITVTGNTVLFTEDAGATTSLFSSAIDTIETTDTITQVILTMANVESGDTLSFGATDIDLNTNGAIVASGFTYTVSSAGATPVVTITHAGTDDGTVNTMLNSLVFNNTTNNDPGTTARTVTLTSVTDSGSGTIADGTVATVNVAKADDAIDITVTGNTVLFTEDAGATTSLFSSTIDTIETTDTITQVILTMANVESGDTLSFGATDIDLNTNGATVASGFTYTVSSAGATPVVTITHAGTDDGTVNTMLNSLVFNNTTNNDPSTTARTVTLTSVTDSGSGTTADGTVATVNVAKADDAIDITVAGNTVLFTEDAGATTSLFSSSIDTIETGDTISELVLTLANVEPGDTLSFGAADVDLNTNGATVAGGFTYTVSSAGVSPVVTITHAGTDDATVNTMLNSLVFNNTANNDPGTTARTVTLTSVTDSGSGTTADGTVATVNVAKADDAIDITVTGNTVTFTEDAGATTALFAAAIDTIETGDTISQVIFTLANVEAGDTLSFGATDIDLNTNGATVASGFTYTVSSAGASPVVTITHAGTDDATVNTMLNSVVFNNTSNNDPSTTARTVTLTSVTDSGSGTTADGTVATVNVAKANDAIDITVTGNTVLFTEDAGATTSLFSSTIDTIETGDTITQVILTMANVESGDTLSFGATDIYLNTNGATVASGFTYTVSSAGATPVVTITHAGTDDGTINTMLNSLVFNNTTNNDPSTTARTVTLTSVTDSGSGTTADGTVATVNVAKANDAIDITVTGNTVLFTEDAGATTSLFSSTIDTIETTDTITQVILTMANVESGDTLSFGATDIDLNTNGATVAGGFTYTVSSAGVSPVVTITHAGTDDATVNTMLNSLVFNNTTNNDPGTTARTVTLTSVTDSGSGTTADGTVATVNVAKADDAIDITVTGNTVLFTEDAGATTSLFSSTIDTIETTDTITQIILTMANVESGDTLSFGATDIDLNTNGATVAGGFTYTVSSAGATPVVTITHAGTDDATVNTMLNSLVFNNTTNNDPSTTARTVTLTSVTDSGSGTTADGTVATVNVAKADDAIDITVTGNTVTFTEDAGATTALFAAAIDTIETGDTISQVIFTLANVEAGDTLSFGATDIDLNTNGATVASGFTYTVSSAGASPVVTITHAGTDDATVNTMLNSVVFNNTSNNDPSTTARTVTLTSVTDSGSGTTADGTVATVNVAKADDAIDITVTGNTVLFTEDSEATTSLFSSTIDTIETTDTITQVVLTMANVESGDTLTFGATNIDLNTNGATVSGGFTYTVSSAGASPVVTITHAGTDDATVNTMLNSLVFNNTANNDPGTTARTVTLTSVTDSGSDTTADGTVATVNVAKADDAIDITVTGNTVLFTEDAGSTTSLFSSTIDTIETTDTITQVILTMANVESGDTLTFGAIDIDLNTNGATVAGGFTYTVSSAGVSPVVTITHAGTDDATVNTMLNSLVFNNTTNNDPSTTARTVTLTSVTDSGSGTTADGTVATVNVAKADDAIDITVTGNTVLFTEDAGATTSLFSSTIDTIETTDTITQVILTMANVESGDTLSFGATNIDLNTNGATVAGGFTYTVSSAGATPVVTITHAGTDDGTVNTMLNSLVFNNTTNNDPSTTARTVTLTSVTDSGSGTTADGTVATVNVAKADDAIDITVTGNTVLFTQYAGATTSLFSSTIDTIETTDTITQVVLTMANVESGDTLVSGFTNIDLNTNGATGPDVSGFTYTVSSAGSSPVVIITHAGTDDATVNSMLNSMVFNNTTNNDPSATARSVMLTSVTDSGSGLVADGTVATVNVNPVNDAPIAANNTVKTNKDLTYAFTSADFNYSDADGDVIASIKITMLPTAGGLQLSGADVTLSQVITKADIDAGNLKFVATASADGAGYASFGFSVNDGITDSVSVYTITVDTPTVTNNDIDDLFDDGDDETETGTDTDTDTDGDDVEFISEVQEDGIVDIFDETSDLTINGMVGLLDSASIGNNDSVFRIAKEYDDKTNEDGDDQQVVDSTNSVSAVNEIELKEKLISDQDLVSSIERSRNYIESLQNDENIVSRSIVGATLSLTAGIAVWLVRGGSIFASFFMSMPLWKRFDPLPLLSLSRKKRREKIDELDKVKEEESNENKAAADLLDTNQKQKAEKGKNPKKPKKGKGGDKS